jgi:tetratricopeptide (TPR) repeat protein
MVNRIPIVCINGGEIMKDRLISELFVNSMFLSVIILVIVISGKVVFSQENKIPEQSENKQCERLILRTRLANIDSLVKSGEVSVGNGHMMKVFAFSELGQCAEHWKQAVEEFESAVTNGSDSISLRIVIGNIFFSDLRNYLRAIEQFEYVIKREPLNFEANLRLTKLYLVTENWDKAIKRAKVLEQLSKYLPKVFYEYFEARALEGMKKYAQAREVYKRFLKFADKNQLSLSEVEDAKSRLKVIEQNLKNEAF